MDVDSEQAGVEADRRLAMSGLGRRQFVVRRRRHGQQRRLRRSPSVVVVQVVSGRAVVVAASSDRVDARRRLRRRGRRRNSVEPVDAGSARHPRRGLSRGAAGRRRARVLLRRHQSLA